MNGEIEATGDLIAGGLLAGAVERESGEGRAGHGYAPGAGRVAGHATCANCATPLTGAYCHACGQSGHIHRSVLHLAEEFFHGLLHFDGKLWRTLPLLMVRPGTLTRRYVEGRRVRYVSPMALFLFCVFLMFFSLEQLPGPRGLDFDRPGGLIAHSLTLPAAKAGPGTPSTGTTAPADATGAKPAGSVNTASADDLESVLDGLLANPDLKLAPNLAMNGVPPGIARNIRHALKNPELAFYKIKESASKLAFVLVPLSVPFIWLAFFWRRDCKMYDHVVFTLHSLSFMAVWVSVLVGLHAVGVRGATLAWAGILVPPAHLFVHVRDAYRLGIAGTLWRTGYLLMVALISLIFYILLIISLGLVD